jgi:GntR family transcriptional repressor for pyruvate dehydrogenase complex
MEAALGKLDQIVPLARNPAAAERVANQLLELVRSGNLKAGDVLPSENDLADALQVSRPVVREALRGLAIMGVVESRQGGRCYITDLEVSRLLAPLQFVISLDESNVDALHQSRLVIECGLIRLGAPLVDGKTLARLREMVAAGYGLTKDPVGFRVLDLEFHETIMKIAGNPFMEVVARSLYELGMEYRRLASETKGVLDRSAAEHDAIVKALETRDPDAAADAMSAHLSSINRTTVDAMKRAGTRRSATTAASITKGRAKR